ncbi:MAG TPA: helix-turn-helix domain-containing protein [Ktedonobacteraceae bacterium]|nr:helix-turn-helix domain-containing protein [Ktedonobacteraceae bacterium]
MYSKDTLILRQTGEHIRQLRRQCSLTQTELGGDHYSKSYVSAVERGSMTPSLVALRFFAERLNKPHDYFEHFFRPHEQSEHFLLPIHTPFLTRSDVKTPDINPLLELLLAQSALYPAVLVRRFAALSFEDMATFPALAHARYVFLKGLLAQKEGEHALALVAFEHALALTPRQYQAVILDAMGMQYVFGQHYTVALSYHERALGLLEEEWAGASSAATKGDKEKHFDLSLLLELHCGDDCRYSGLYTQAVKHYTNARNCLRTTHDISVAGQVYLGLGYCLYASLYQRTALLPSAYSDEEQERAFQQAIGFLLQSRMLYQASQDLAGETRSRLRHALVLLDFSAWKQQLEGDKRAFALMQCQALLENAQEQCEQIVIGWRSAGDKALTAEKTLIFSALAYLTRVYCQRATLGRLEDHVDTARLACIRATGLSQKLLEIAAEENLSWAMVDQFLALSKDHPGVYASLPQPPQHTLLETAGCSSICQYEIYSAIAEVAEERGRMADTPDYAQLCFSSANKYCQLALKMIRAAVEKQECDPGYATRSYRQCISLLQARTQAALPLSEETAQELLAILKEWTFLY